ncbi:hypothetical protein EDD52_111159 [Primorskyibacter sedentarius]|uniref:Uncharacterized protein n=1 Tax=Primorskyibacter sedentarius TaxID=745311 RepID=A0A4V2UNC2_9RHOB|nr:hypothetical protein EDD52_111159 [Primorskyibacter sedentarius]
MSVNKSGRPRARCLIKAVVFAAIVLVAIFCDLLYDRYITRSAVVEATTGTLQLVLTRELNGKFFENAIVCRRQQDDDAPVARGAPYGCSRRTHALTPPEDEQVQTRPQNDEENIGRENYNLTLPAGTKVVLTARPGLVALRVVDVPTAYAEAEAGLLVGGGVILDARAIPAFGTLPMTGRALIGASQSETDFPTITTGSYQFTGPTPAALLDGEWRVVREGKLLSGATVYFAERGSDVQDPLEKPAPETRLTVSIPDPGSSLLRVTGISDAGPMVLKIAYYSTEGPTVRPSITNVLLADPILTFLASLILGLIAFYEFLRSRN